MINIKQLCDKNGINLDIGEMSDGYHTFNSLYHQRLILFAALVNAYPDISWKTKRHEDEEECFGGGWFIVGIDTPEGSYTYHYEDNYYSLFDCKELERGKHWDGHTEKDVTRLLSLPSAQPEQRWIPCSERLPEAEDCPMDCLVTRKSKYIGNYTDMAVCEKNGMWTHEDWDAIVLGDVKDGKSTGLISTRDDDIIAWMPLPEPYKEE